jgi:phage FluMu gp28-like protein
MLFNIVPPQIVSKTNESELIVYFKNGSYIQLKGADDPDALRGAGPVGLVLDEFAEQKPDAWGVLEPIVRANGGWVWFVGTPKGRNHLYDMYVQGQMGHHEWKSWILKASTSGIISAEQLEESRKSMPGPLYNQEWECEFLEGQGQVFRGVREICTALPKKPETNKHYVMGVDVAKVTDYTVLTVYDRSNNSQVYQDRFQTLDWPFQKQKIKSVSDHYNHALVVLDATGVGDPIADDLIRAGVPVEPFKISEISKRELVEKLTIWIDQERFRMLPIEDTLLEFDNFSYELGPTGKIRYGAKTGKHDDIVMAHALAIYGLEPVTTPIKTIVTNPVRMEFLKQKRTYEKQDDWGFTPENDIIEYD